MYNSTYNFPNQPARYCSGCKQDGMVCIKKKNSCCGIKPDGTKCQTCPSFNFPDQPAMYCVSCKTDGMVRVHKRKKCCGIKEDGTNCQTNPSFNYPNTKPALFCSECKAEGMVRVTGKKKLCLDCEKPAAFNYRSEKKPLYCKGCKKEDMVNVVNKRCHFPECDTFPIYNFKGEKTGIVCDKHKDKGMIDIFNKTKMCRDPECDGETRATFNFPNEKAGIYCEEHQKLGMVAVLNRSKLCKDESGCDTRANFNYPNEKKALFCDDHKKHGMVDVLHNLCHCGTRANYGGIRQQPSRCTDHKQPNMICDPRKRCTHQVLGSKKKCKEPAIYGFSSHIVCERHKTDDMTNFIERSCANCGFLYILSESNKCEGCDTVFKQKRTKTKEMQAKYFFDTNGFNYISHDKKIKFSALRSRPDFLFISIHEGHFCVVEVDEFKHSAHAEECERSRMKNIAKELALYALNKYGKSMSTIFLRFNPDSYSVHHNGKNKSCNPAISSRQKILGTHLNKILNMSAEEVVKHGLVSMTHLFFDNFDENNIPIVPVP